MKADFRIIFSEIKVRLQEVHKDLREFPSKRKIVITKEESKQFASSTVFKPRFRPSFNKIKRKLRDTLMSIFDNMNLIIKPYSPDNFANLNFLLLSYYSIRNIIFK